MSPVVQSFFLPPGGLSFQLSRFYPILEGELKKGDRKMRDIYLFLRRMAGFLGLLFGGKKAWEARKELKKLDTAQWSRRIISDGILLNEIPSPTEDEHLRMKFISKRLEEFGISNVFSDEWGNVLALFPAFGSRQDFMLLVAEVGDCDYSPLENSVQITRELASGQNLGERSIGAASLLVFAEFAQATGFHLEKNLMVLFTRSSSVDEREDAFRHFLGSWADRISCAILVHGTKLGVLETKPMGTYRLSINVKSQERELLSPNAGPSAASIMGNIASRLGDITWDGPQKAMVNIARMEAGDGFGHWATQGEMDIEIISDDDKTLESIKHSVVETIESASEGLKYKIESLIRFRRSVGDPRRNAPLIDTLRTALEKVQIKTEEGLVSDKISLLNEKGIPAVCVGMTKATGNQNRDEIELGLIDSGFRQLLLVIEGGSRALEPVKEGQQ
ncbi:MAG: hypothetical protein A2Z96_07120 [Spirochaetes bacterium GWB1_48_6]|nr:MAG: hypothetical protein A2Z96_07120 [Spirochaetes bacterium GWB1_48_6]